MPSNNTQNLLLLALLIACFCLSPASLTYFLDPSHWFSPTSRPPAPATPPACVCTTPAATMSWFQKQFTMPTKSRGSYLVTDHVVSNLPEIKDYKVGLLNLFVQHTSCALSLNENFDEDVREDMSDALDRCVLGFCHSLDLFVALLLSCRWCGWLTVFTAVLRRRTAKATCTGTRRRVLTTCR